MPIRCWSPGHGLGERIVGGPCAVEDRMPAHYETAARMLGVIENRMLGPADHLLKTGRRCGRSRPYLLPHAVAVFQARGRRSRQGRPIPIRTSAAKVRIGPPASAAAAA